MMRERIARCVMMAALAAVIIMSSFIMHHESGALIQGCPEDSVMHRQRNVSECVHLDAMTTDSRTYALEWVSYCGTVFTRHRFVMMRYDEIGRLTAVRCVRNR
jgi:hypothetical protein